MSGKVVGFFVQIYIPHGYFRGVKTKRYQWDLFENLTRAKKFQIELAVKSYDCLYKYNYNPPLCSRQGLRPRPH